MNSSLHASMVLTYRSGPSQGCGLCHEPDHITAQCAMLALQPYPPTPLHSRPQPLFHSGPTFMGGPVRRPVRPETLERICVSWNRGRCSYAACNFHRVCASCKKRGHKARNCEEAPADSPYKLPLSTASKSN